MRVWLWLHLLSAVVWIGGMFLAYMAVRPAAAEALEPPQRLRLWAGIFRRFFPWVWVAVVLLFASGFSMMGMGVGGRYVMTMATVAIVMTLIYGHIYFAPWAALKKAVAAEDWKGGGAALGRIRTLVGVNLVLGLLVVTIAALGPLA
jgi:uncharacterized membrane protein